MSSFALRHLPALVMGATTTLGSLIPLFNAPWAMHEFGLPDRLTRSRDAQTIFLLNNGRTFTIGAMIWTFYLMGEYRTVDIILTLVGGILGVSDAAVCWKEGMQGKAVFRLCSSWVIAAWGYAGMTQSYRDDDD